MTKTIEETGEYLGMWVTKMVMCARSYYLRAVMTKLVAIAKVLTGALTG